MTTPAKQAEADAASTAFHVALTQIGVSSLAEALKLWEDVPPTAKPATAASWLGRAVALVMSRRSASRELARAYYRLVRALHTGTTVPDIGDPDPTFVSLNDLREQFAALVDPTGEVGSDDEQIKVEPIDNLDTEHDRIEKAAEQEARTVLVALGPVNQAKLVEAIGDDAPASEVDRLRDEAHDRAGARQAAAVERVVQDGARSELWLLANGDRRCIGYVRLSRTGTPCGWCAMLISRGPVYRTEKSATYSDGDLYHDNCHCFAMPIFTRAQYDNSDLYALNRRYAEEWPRVTRGLSGKSALTAWRNFIRREQRIDRASNATTNAQEA